MTSQYVREVDEFLKDWEQDPLSLRQWFVRYFQVLSALDGVELSFVGRPGVSYSLRPRSTREGARQLFAMVDVIDDDPSSRWISVCFYEDVITDPEERGEIIPGGLQGEDGYCFDLLENDPALAQYILVRLQEAAAAGR